MRDALDQLSLPPLLKKPYAAVLWLAMLWAVFNCLYVYLVLHGDRSYRIESAVFAMIFLMLPLVVAGRRQDAHTVELSPAQQRLLLSLATGLWLLTILPLLNFSFLSDDFVFLARYRTVRDVAYPSQFFRPAFAAVFLVLARLGGGSPVPFHAAGLLLHLSSACLVYSLTRRLFAATGPAVACFTLFLLNPLQLEVTLWSSGLQESLWTFFMLAALRCYIGARLLSLGRLSGTIALVVCALLSKESAVCFVPLLPAADYAFFRMNRGPLLASAYATCAGTLVAYLLVRRRFASVESSFFVLPSRFFLKQFVAMPYRFFVQPLNVDEIHLPLSIPCVASLLIIGLLFAVIVLRGTSARLLSGPALILISTLPLYSYFFVGADLSQARYLYFAAAGWALLISELLVNVMKQPTRLAVAIATLTVLSFVSLQLNLRPWRTAGDLVNTMKIGLRQGKSTASIIAEWQTRAGVKLELKDGVPPKYRGVWIFLNGYPEFLQIVRNDRNVDQ